MAQTAVPSNGADQFTEVTDPDVREAIEAGARSGRLTPFNKALLDGKMLFVPDGSDFKPTNPQSQTFTSRGKKMRTRTADGGRYFWLVDYERRGLESLPGYTPDTNEGDDLPPLDEDEA